MIDQFRRPMRIFPRNPTEAERQSQQEAFDRIAESLQEQIGEQAQIYNAEPFRTPLFTKVEPWWRRWWDSTMRWWNA